MAEYRVRDERTRRELGEARLSASSAICSEWLRIGKGLLIPTFAIGILVAVREKFANAYGSVETWQISIDKTSSPNGTTDARKREEEGSAVLRYVHRPTTS